MTKSSSGFYHGQFTSFQTSDTEEKVVKPVFCKGQEIITQCECGRMRFLSGREAGLDRVASVLVLGGGVECISDTCEQHCKQGMGVKQDTV